MLNILVTGAEHLHAELVQRVVVAASYAHRPPRIAALHIPLHPYFLGLLAESLFLRLILQLEQQPLLSKCLNSVHRCKITK